MLFELGSYFVFHLYSLLSYFLALNVFSISIEARGTMVLRCFRIFAFNEAIFFIVVCWYLGVYVVYAYMGFLNNLWLCLPIIILLHRYCWVMYESLLFTILSVLIYKGHSLHWTPLFIIPQKTSLPCPLKLCFKINNCQLNIWKFKIQIFD